MKNVYDVVYKLKYKKKPIKLKFSIKKYLSKQSNENLISIGTEFLSNCSIIDDNG